MIGATTMLTRVSRIVVICMSLFVTVVCHGTPLIVGGELVCNYHQAWREFVLPSCGPYERYQVSRNGLRLPDHERAILSWLQEPANSPTYVSPLLVAPNRKSRDANETRVEALCVLFQEAFDPPLITPYPQKCRDGFFDKLGELSELRHLELFSYAIDVTTFEGIRKLAQLRYLGMPINSTDDHLKSIVSLDDLVFLNASGTEIEGPGLSFLGRLPKLTTLDLRRTRVQTEALSYIGTCESLSALLLSDTNLTDEHVGDFPFLATLKCITLHRTSVTNEGFESILRQAPNLEYVSIYDTEIDESQAKRSSLQKGKSELALDVQRPQELRVFLNDHLYYQAYMGNRESQVKLSRRYRAAVRATYGRSFAKLERERQIIHRWIGPADAVELLAWNIVLSEQQYEALEMIDNTNLREHEIREQETRMLERLLDVEQVHEAQRKARVFQKMMRRGTREPELPRSRAPQLYQYGFEMANRRVIP